MTWKLKILSKKNSLNKDFIPLFQQIELELSRKLFKQESDVDSTERPRELHRELNKNKNIRYTFKKQGRQRRKNKECNKSHY